MRTARSAFSLIVVAATLVVGATAEARPADEGFMRLGRQVAPPPGYLALCQRLPSACGMQAPPAAATLSPGGLRPNAIAGSSDARRAPYDWRAALGGPDALGQADEVSQAVARLQYSAKLLDELKRVTRSVNAQITPKSDLEAFGREDFWALPLTEGLGKGGNCKHYVLEKRKVLIDEGFDPESLSIAIVRIPRGEIHAVLVVSTTAGDYVLDNLTPWVVKWSDTGYDWIIRQGPRQQTDWFTVLS
ncbi:transglutaminase-like cysteine peptidase [Caulobacter segnis]|nr:transglutaminase-like cysteine peptidase [Caulobacter segnis]